MSFGIESVLWASTFVFSVYIVYLVYRIYAFNRLNKAWLAVALGFLFIVLLRFLTLLNGNGLFPSFFELWYIYDPLLRILNNICFAIGFYSMLKSFEEFDLVQKKIKRKIIANGVGKK